MLTRHVELRGGRIRSNGPDARGAKLGAERIAALRSRLSAGSNREAKRSGEVLIGDLVITQQIWARLGTHPLSYGAPLGALRRANPPNRRVCD